MKRRNRERLAAAEQRAEHYERMAEHLAACHKRVATLLRDGMPTPIRPESARKTAWAAYEDWANGTIRHEVFP